jgi:4-hydroxy-3-methylbut-2-enyl diphosphate reductase
MVRETLKAVAGGCIERFREVRVMDTICDATARRQQEASQLARFAEAVVVIGGRESANTRHLVEVCSAIQPRTYHVQRASELRPEWLVPGGRVAITAGASTPATAISEVAERLRAMTGGQEKTA